jgi:3-hydroxyacyl-CoA dehydrogenase
MRVGIVGLGQIGEGLADLLADRGFSLIIYVRRRQRGEAFLDSLRKRLEKKSRRGRLTRPEVEECLDRITIAASMSEFRDVEMAVEAIREDSEAKREVLSELGRTCPAKTILASATSEIPIDDLAAHLPGASRVIGLHFLSPLRLSTAVEVIPGTQTAPDVVEKAVAWCGSLGKRGFVFRRSAVNRLLASYIAEGLSLCLTEGIDPQLVDRLLFDGGMMLGPLSTLDLVGLDIAMDVFEQQGTSLVSGDAQALGIVRVLCAEGHLGRKTEKGIFLYGKNGKGTNPRLLSLLAEAREQLAVVASGGNAVDRVWLRLINEYLFCSTQGIGSREDMDAVLCEVLGVDEGPLPRIREAEAADLASRLAVLERSFGNRYDPSLSLIESFRESNG